MFVFVDEYFQKYACSAQWAVRCCFLISCFPRMLLRLYLVLTRFPLPPLLLVAILLLHYNSNVIIIITISFMQGIYRYIPETNNVPKE
jgi:hypothetical protein